MMFKFLESVGWGGIGKTTLTRALYERICHQYDYHCFIDDVSKLYRDSSSLGVQNQLISQSLNEKNLVISNACEGTRSVWSRLHNVKALVVLDNVDQVEQLRMFTGNRDTLLRECLGGGSRIIIVSRDKHLLRTHGVDDVYQVQPLNRKKAKKLFCRNAFKVNYILSDYEQLARDVLSHVEGHPLAIEVIGSSLFGRNVSQWESALARLKENKSKNIMDVLRISFDQLDEEDKETFLDIACFWNRFPEGNVKEILNIRGFHPEYSVQVLVDKSLITTKSGKIYMHSLLEDLGRCIVREKSPKEPIKWSRLWEYEDLHNAMLENQVTENLEAIVVKSHIRKYELRADGLSKIKHLKLLVVQNMVFSGSLNHLSNEIGYLTWDEYPFECLPPSFQPNKLVELNLRGSSIQRLWKGTKPLPNLKRLDLSHSKSLVEMPDVTEALNLEKINLEGCIQLRKTNPSIGLLRKLAALILENCKNLGSLPNSILGLNSLEYLNISGCSKLYHNELLDEPRNTEHLKKFCLLEAPIHSQSTPSFLKKMFLWPLDLLYSRAQRDSVSCLLPSSPTLPCLRELSLGFCNLVKIPDAIGKLRCLEKLDLRGNNFATLPNFKHLFKLYYLNLEHWKRLKYLPDLPSRTHFPSKFYEPSFTSSKVGVNYFWYWNKYSADMPGLIIFNCPELIERERRSSMSVSWMMQMVQATHQYRYGRNPPPMFYPDVGSVIPGSEIPRWFNNQFVSMDNSIIIYPPLHDNNWISFVCCAIFSMDREIEKDPPLRAAMHFSMPVDFRIDLVADWSDHMLLLSFSQEYFIRPGLVDRPDISRFGSFGFKMDDIHITDKKFAAVDVKKYGYRWVCEQDLQLSNSTMMHGGNLTSRKRNFSVMEENR